MFNNKDYNKNEDNRFDGKVVVMSSDTLIQLEDTVVSLASSMKDPIQFIKSFVDVEIGIDDTMEFGETVIMDIEDWHDLIREHYDDYEDDYEDDDYEEFDWKDWDY